MFKPRSSKSSRHFTLLSLIDCQFDTRSPTNFWQALFLVIFLSYVHYVFSIVKIFNNYCNIFNGCELCCNSAVCCDDIFK